MVNTSRGAVIDELALIEALPSGRLADAGLDVICGERDPCRSERPLLQYAAENENLMITPHVGVAVRWSHSIRPCCIFKRFDERAAKNSHVVGKMPAT